MVAGPLLGWELTSVVPIDLVEQPRTETSVPSQAATIHPFPARMAPDIARQALDELEPGARVLDPMCGSGTVLRAAVERGLDGVGVDIDPLAVFMSQAWTDGRDHDTVRGATEVVNRARKLRAGKALSPPDQPTADFIRYWFAPQQGNALARLATVLRRRRKRDRLLLTVAFSRLIITKEVRASLARDTSHSRPHRVTKENDFDVYDHFVRAAKLIERRREASRCVGHAEITLGDARALEAFQDDQFDAVVTSPPYLNAIDYMRGHRMTLVWLGYDVGSLRSIRSVSVGAENGLPDEAVDVSGFVNAPADRPLAARYVGWVRRYVLDMRSVSREVARVVKPGGKVTIVVGNSHVRGAKVDNSRIVSHAAVEAGLTLIGATTREIPARRRYLPPPKGRSGSMGARMRTESVLTFSS